MNIKKQMKKMIKSNKEYGVVSYYLPNNREDFIKKSNDYLDSETYKDAIKNADSLMKFVLNFHEKGKIIAPILSDLFTYEKEGGYNYKKQRMHYLHLTNVFLLGLYLYHLVPIIKRNINKKMESTTKTINDVNCYKNNWKYSEGCEYGEFLYRWRLAAIIHDIGYRISLIGDNSTEINKAIYKLLDDNSVNINKIIKYKNKDLLKDLEIISNIQLSEYYKYQEKYPYRKKVKYDHGLIGAILFLYRMNTYFDEELKDQDSKCENGVFFHRNLLDYSLLYTAKAVALHNLTQYKEAIDRFAKNNRNKIYSLKENSLDWLLFITDILQEWDKPRAIEFNEDNKLPNTSLKIFYCNSCNKLIIIGIPKKKKEEIRNKIRKYTEPNNFICIL